MDNLRSTFIWFMLIFLLVLLYPPALIIWLLTVPFDRRLWLLHKYSCFWASTLTWLNPYWRVTIEGKEKIDHGGVFIFVSNHQSLLDILVIYRTFIHFKWVAKAELFKMPVAGWNMWANRYIAIKRGKRTSILKMMEDAEKTIRAGSSVMIFPEGTRSEDTRLRYFKEGAFKLAKLTKTPIIPVVLDGTGNALPPRGYVFKGKHFIKLKFLDPIPLETILSTDSKDLMIKTRELMIDELKKNPATNS